MNKKTLNKQMELNKALTKNFTFAIKINIS